MTTTLDHSARTDRKPAESTSESAAVSLEEDGNLARIDLAWKRVLQRKRSLEPRKRSQ